MTKDFKIVAKVAKFRQIWSHYPLACSATRTFFAFIGNLFA